MNLKKLNEYNIGDTVTLRSDFKAGTELTDPSAVALTVTDPSGIVGNYTYAGGTIDKDAVGQYSKGVLATEAGEWIYLFVGTGAVAASGTRRFAVRRAGT